MLADGFALYADATLVKGPGSLRVGWTAREYTASRRIHALVTNAECSLPLVTFVIDSGTWNITRLLATTHAEDAVLQALGVDFFEGSSAPY